MGVIGISNVTRVSTNNYAMAACSGSCSSTSESSPTASCRPSTSSANDADDEIIPTDTTATSSTDSEALSLLEKVCAPSKGASCPNYFCRK